MKLDGLPHNRRPSQNAYLALVRKEKFGYVDKNGNIVITPRFDMARDFNADGLAEVTDGCVHGYINTEGKMVKVQFITELTQGTICRTHNYPQFPNARIMRW